MFHQRKSTVRGSNIEACGPYHSLNTQFVRSPSQAALLNACPRRSMCTLECRPPSPPKLSLVLLSMKLFNFVGDHICVRLKSRVRGSDIEACGPYHSLNTQFVRSPSQAALLNVVRGTLCVHQKCRPSSPPKLMVQWVGWILFNNVKPH